MSGARGMGLTEAGKNFVDETGILHCPSWDPTKTVWSNGLLVSPAEAESIFPSSEFRPPGSWVDEKVRRKKEKRSRKRQAVVDWMKRNLDG